MRSSIVPFCALLRTCLFCTFLRSFWVQPRLERPRLGTADKTSFLKAHVRGRSCPAPSRKLISQNPPPALYKSLSASCRHFLSQTLRPLTRNHYENNSLRVIFVILGRFCPLDSCGKEKPFQGIACDIRKCRNNNDFRINFS